MGVCILLRLELEQARVGSLLVRWSSRYSTPVVPFPIPVWTGLFEFRLLLRVQLPAYQICRCLAP